MKRIAVLVFFVLIAFPLSIAAQTSTFFEHETTHYRVLSQISEEHAAETANKLEALFTLFNEYFHFETDELTSRLRVRILDTKAKYDTYLQRVIEQTREDFVYLHYTDLAKSELVGYQMNTPEEFEVSLKHQSVIQFLRAFISNPPLWMREGFAVYFEEVKFDEALSQAVYHENLAWLETLKSIVDGGSGVQPIPMSQMLVMDVETARSQIDVFYPQAWGIVSFLLNSQNQDHNRIMWDSISALDPEATLVENSQSSWNQAFAWEEETLLIESFINYVEERRSFRGLVEDGIDQYAAGELERAEESFVTALKLREDNFIPYYYLGLINYDRQNYSLAEFYYSEALDRGATEALTYYALGVNAYADNKFDEAAEYLRQTAELDPANYEDKAQQLLDRIGG